MVGKICIIVLLLVCSALFSSCETAFSSVNKIRLKHNAAQGDARAERTLQLANQFDNVLTAILIGNNVVNILSASLGTVVCTELFGASGVGISTALMTVLVLIFGEILPKSYAKANAERCALFFSAPLAGLVWVLTPVVRLFQLLSSLLRSEKSEPSVTEDELKVIIEEIEEEGVLEEQESDLVRSALEFDEIRVNEILIPRVNLVAAELSTPVSEIKELFLTEYYSRLPVYDKTIDNVVGILTSMNFFKLLDEGGTDIRSVLQPVLRLPERTLISNALREMQRSKAHMAVIIDQYGGTDGIVTMEDIIEELVGEIYDEADEVIPMLTRLSDRVYEVAGELSVSDLLERLSLPETCIETESTTVAGWAMELFGHVPAAGEEIRSGLFALTVTEADEQRLKKLKLALETGEASAC